jgi:hypothetical protein
LQIIIPRTPGLYNSDLKFCIFASMQQNLYQPGPFDLNRVEIAQLMAASIIEMIAAGAVAYQGPGL